MFGEEIKERRNIGFRKAVTGAAIVLSLLLIVYIAYYHKIEIVYTHLFYLPIILTAMWYYRKSMFVAFGLGLAHISAGYWATGAISHSSILRTVVFLIVAWFTGALAERRDRFYLEWQQTKNQTEIILQSVGEGIIGLNHKGEVFFANPAALRILGFTEKEMIGMPRNAFISSHGEYFVKKDGARILVDYSERTTPEAEAINGVVVVFNDLTEKVFVKNEMSRLDRLNTLGEMAATLAHEIRNPLTVVRGYLQLFREKDDQINLKEKVPLMIGELDRATTIIGEYLSLGKNDHGTKELADLNTIVRGLEPLLETHAASSAKSLRLELEEMPSLYLVVNQIRQLILNLANNGLEAMNPGGTLTLRTYKEKDKIVLAVEDQGTGIAPEIAEKMGTPFFSTKKQGTGLGFAVCHTVAEFHNAVIDLDTSTKGTTIYVRFGL